MPVQDEITGYMGWYRDLSQPRPWKWTAVTGSIFETEKKAWAMLQKLHPNNSSDSFSAGSKSKTVCPTNQTPTYSGKKV